ncbi:MAG: lysophospholipase L1-like esterase [Myxococcota bacterium]|jgi:lysophospholipase L1-like esterase
MSRNRRGLRPSPKDNHDGQHEPSLRPPARCGATLIAKRLALSLFGLVLGIIACELIARFAWQEPWYERLLDEQRTNETHTYTRNQWNLRDRDYASPKPEGRRRVLMLGDSFTFGQGVVNDQEIFPEILEANLTKTRIAQGKSSVEILNGGLPGSLTDEWLRVWEATSQAFDPDVLVIVFFLRDGTRTASVPEFFDKIRADIAQRNKRSRLYKTSYLVRMLQDATDRKRVASLYAERFQSSYFGAEHQTGEWRTAQKNLIKLKQLAQERAVEVGLVVFPVLVELNEPYPFQQIVDTVSQFSVDTGFAVHNLLPDFMGEYAPNYWVSSFDQHPNARGHALVAERLEPFVTGLLDRADATPSP